MSDGIIEFLKVAGSGIIVATTAVLMNIRQTRFAKRDLDLKFLDDKIEKTNGISSDVLDCIEDIGELVANVEELKSDISSASIDFKADDEFLARYDFSLFSNLSKSGFSHLVLSEDLSSAISDVRTAYRHVQELVISYNSSKSGFHDIDALIEALRALQEGLVDLRDEVNQVAQSLTTEKTRLEGLKFFKVF